MHELEANRRIGPHDRIVPLLAAFKYRSRYHFVLPWAQGGNLAELWMRFAANPEHVKPNLEVASWYSTAWLLSECSGLAAGLATIHGFGTAIDDGSVIGRSASLHADIKPENILCFSQDSDGLGPYTLKFADFGEAQEVHPFTKCVEVDRVAHTKTYRPPEHDTEATLSLKYDIWCLGCVYLDFITWAVAGGSEVEKFATDRMNEPNDEKVVFAQGKLEADTFFRKVATYPRSLSYSDFRFGYESSPEFDPAEASNSARKRYTWWFERPSICVSNRLKVSVTSVCTPGFSASAMVD